MPLIDRGLETISQAIEIIELLGVLLEGAIVAFKEIIIGVTACWRRGREETSEELEDIEAASHSGDGAELRQRAARDIR